MDEDEDQTGVVQPIAEKFELSLETTAPVSMNEFRKLLEERIEFLLDHDFEKLLWLLYRIDVSEAMAKKALAEQADWRPAQVLAGLIMDRQLEKIKSRRQYRTGQQGEWL